MDRDDKGRFAKGNNGNPGGRPKGLGDRVRQATKDGEEIITFLLSVGRNTDEPTKMRLEAYDILLDRGWGKPAQSVKLSGDEDEPIAVKGYVRVSPDDWPTK